jgi:hypothetical protein
MPRPQDEGRPRGAEQRGIRMAADETQSPDTRLEELLRTIKEQHPHDSESQLRQRFTEAVENDSDLNKAAIRHFIRNPILN